ncbi:uncharacterized protein I206_104340 [Kwoniella pini CBS 10737]|uniref:Uncharacterized protein n=1 Tax=Kwoniella pini CBS 10737 TaxID=1296096 RepID=A0A1B9I1Y0_9TREE|nr:uncharacterized protein I206_04082 [Kwoniella pini CBS 10737]OCF49560.1 hypothetical protein I206_04082 [Kwoniella pini CBS 10737]
MGIQSYVHSKYPKHSTVILKPTSSHNSTSNKSKYKKQKRKYGRPIINERDSSLYLPKAYDESSLPFQDQKQDRITVDLPTFSPLSTFLSEINIDIDSNIRYNDGIELDRPFSTCSNYSNNSLGLNFFPTPPVRSSSFSFSTTQPQFQDYEDNFEESVNTSSPSTEDTTYVSTPTTSYDHNNKLDLEHINIDQWKSRRTLVSFSFSTSDLNQSSQKDCSTQQDSYLFGNTGIDNKDQAYNFYTSTSYQLDRSRNRHSVYSEKNYTNWAREKFYSSEINLATTTTSILPTPPLTPLQIIPVRRSRSPSPTTKKNNKLAKGFNKWIDRMTVTLDTRHKNSIANPNEVDATALKESAGSDTMTAPPPVPARSRLRSVPSKSLLVSEPVSPDNDVGTSTMKIITHRQSSLFRLPVDPPQVPTTPTSPNVAEPSPISSKDTPNAPTNKLGRKKASKVVERDPHKVRDGLQAKESTSGVYTPGTFPGAQGPRPSHFPSHVYTPTNFALYPQASSSPISPSASSTHSSSSSQSDSTAPPKTPLSPTGRISKAVSSNIRRFSSGIVTLKEKTYPTTVHQRSVTTPMMENGEYLPQSTSFSTDSNGGHSRGSSWASWANSPTTPRLSHSNSGYFPPLNTNGAGLGVGLDENKHRMDGTVVIEAGMDPTNFAAPRSSVLGMGSGSLAGKGKRKPVPRLGGGEEAQPVHAL